MSASTSPRSESLPGPVEGAATRFQEEPAPPLLTALARAGGGLSLWSALRETPDWPGHCGNASQVNRLSAVRSPAPTWPRAPIGKLSPNTYGTI